MMLFILSFHVREMKIGTLGLTDMLTYLRKKRR
jgi:hypothetical protein